MDLSATILFTEEAARAAWAVLADLRTKLLEKFPHLGAGDCHSPLTPSLSPFGGARVPEPAAPVSVLQKVESDVDRRSLTLDTSPDGERESVVPAKVRLQGAHVMVIRAVAAGMRDCNAIALWIRENNQNYQSSKASVQCAFSAIKRITGCGRKEHVKLLAWAVKNGVLPTGGQVAEVVAPPAVKLHEHPKQVVKVAVESAAVVESARGDARPTAKTPSSVVAPPVGARGKKTAVVTEMLAAGAPVNGQVASISEEGLRIGRSLIEPFTALDLQARLDGDTMRAYHWIAQWKRSGLLETVGFNQYRRSAKFGGAPAAPATVTAGAGAKSLLEQIHDEIEAKRNV